MLLYPSEQGYKVTSDFIWIICILCSDVIRMALHFCIFFPKTHNLNLIMKKKKSDDSKLRALYYKIIDQSSSTLFKVMKIKERLRYCNS